MTSACLARNFGHARAKFNAKTAIKLKNTWTIYHFQSGKAYLAVSEEIEENISKPSSLLRILHWSSLEGTAIRALFCISNDGIKIDACIKLIVIIWDNYS